MHYEVENEKIHLVFQRPISLKKKIKFKVHKHFTIPYWILIHKEVWKEDTQQDIMSLFFPP